MSALSVTSPGNIFSAGDGGGGGTGEFFSFSFLFGGRSDMVYKMGLIIFFILVFGVCFGIGFVI